ncbi:MAG: hypothetical protein Q8O76_01455 [Chloroflexota bacterium]|nr:hypothetical protein [Chloroflexota bacterium]
MTDLRKAAIVGVYLTRQGNLEGTSADELYVEAVKGALDDAGLKAQEIDGLIGTWVDGSPAPFGAGFFPTYFPGAFCDQFGTTLRYFDETRAGASSPQAGLARAVTAIAEGRASTVVIAAAASRPGLGLGPVPGALSGAEFKDIWGTSRTADYAIIARRHMHQFGTTSEQLAEVAVAARQFAVMNPGAVMHSKGPITVQDVVNSRMIAAPMHLLDCCLVNDGGGAVVVTTAERARDLRKKPIRLLGVSEAYVYNDAHYMPRSLTFGAAITGPKAFATAGVGHQDIDVAYISDHFTIDVIVELEDLGFCAKGEGGHFVEGGTLQLGGKLPLNTDGGYLSHSHAANCGLFPIVEAVKQLRGECGRRQVKGAKIALLQGTGGAFCASVTSILGVD